MQTTLTANESAFAGGIVGGAAVAMSIFLVVWFIMMVIAWWKIFEKAGEKGWKALIPIYDLYILYKIVGMKMWFWISLLLGVVGGIVIAAMGFDPNTLNANSFSGNTLAPAIIYVVELVISFVISVVVYARLSKVFGHGVGFTLGLVFLSGIFMLILGFGSSKYDKKVAKTWQ
ncbi:hypothetical protein IKD67_02130 [Candidatus Saccharibacteria bacterium]|nr:hypothetical protein [Candidatus Saccharibacteria bacterium]